VGGGAREQSDDGGDGGKTSVFELPSGRKRTKLFKRVVRTEEKGSKMKMETVDYFGEEGMVPLD